MLETIPGFILTRQWQDTDSGQSLLFWLASDQGPLLIEVTDSPSVCFVAEQHAVLAGQLLKDFPGSTLAAVNLKSFAGDQVKACYLPGQKQLSQFRSRVGDRFTLFEADLRPTDRYLMERFLKAEVIVQGEFEARSGYLYSKNPRMQPRSVRPKLNVASLDIETSYTEHILYSIAVSIRADSGNSESHGNVEKIFMVNEAGRDLVELDQAQLEFWPDEKSLLEAFLHWFASQDPDVVIGWSVVGFDLSFLQQRCDHYKIPFTLGRDQQVVSWRTATQSGNKQFALVPGRVVLDGIELLRTATYQFESFSLENVSRELLGRGKLVHDVDARAAEIQTMFRDDKYQLARYNLEDCNLVHDVFAHTNLLEFALERSRLTGLDVDRAGGSVAAFDFLYLPKLHRQGYVAPVVPEDARGGAPGGFVLNSLPGIYSNVIVLDFKSLYPSIIRTFNVDPLALVASQEEANPIPGYKNAYFSRSRVILPDIIAALWTARDKAKRQQLSAMSQAIKIIMNSFYGVLGTPGCRFFDDRLVSSITLRGHEILQTTRDLIEAQGYRVIYGDTDSVFVLIDAPEGQVNNIGVHLTNYLNDWWQAHLEENYQVKSCLEVEFETHFLRFLMPTVRGSEVGSKKRYAGVIEQDGQQKLVFKGLETVRSDWSPLAREFQQELYGRVFRNEPVTDYIREVVSGVKDLPLRQLVLRKRLRRQLQEYQKNVPPHVRAARLADEIRVARGLAPAYASGGWIEYVMTTSGPEPFAYVRSPVDLDFYVARQLSPIADAILAFENTSMAKILDKQMALF
ncbi:MAG: DNA polymerase II [Pseudomonadales bacterium]